MGASCWTSAPPGSQRSRSPPRAAAAGRCRGSPSAGPASRGGSGPARRLPRRPGRCRSLAPPAAAVPDGTRGDPTPPSAPVLDIYMYMTYVVRMHRRHHGRGNRSRRQIGPDEWAVRARVERFVEPALLLLLKERPRHGYELIELLPELAGGERADVGNLYRFLRRLES